MILRSRRSPTKWAFAVYVTLGCAACSSSSTSSAAPRVFTGEVDGMDVRVAVVATTHHARVFFCGGDASFATSTHWFLVDIGVSGQLASPSSADGGLSFGGQVGDADVRGSFVTGDGKSHMFVASPVSAGTIAGLYEAPAPCGKIGLIVAQSSTAASATGQGACVGSPGANGATPVEQVTPLRPLTRAANGTIRVTVAGSTAPIAAGPAAAPAE
jgi:hypothetical protein